MSTVSLRLSLGVVVVACLSVLSAPCSGQTLDQKAYSAVWERLKAVLPEDTPIENVHALKVIVSATWAKRDRAGLSRLSSCHRTRNGVLHFAHFATKAAGDLELVASVCGNNDITPVER